MSKFFIGIYNFFQKHKALLYSFLTICVVAMALAASRISIRQNITDFFPTKGEGDKTAEVFQNLNVKDKMVVIFSPVGNAPVDSLIVTAEEFANTLNETCGEYLKGIMLRIDDRLVGGVSDFIYNNLPIFLTEADYVRLDTLITRPAIERRMRQNYQNMISPIGIGTRKYIMRDPMGIGTQTLENLQDFEIESGNAMVDNYLFTGDTSSLMMILTPKYNLGHIGENKGFVIRFEEELQKFNNRHTGVCAEYFGGASVSVYNALQIQNDTTLTSLIALIIIAVFISLIFKRKRTIPLVIVPALFGGLFALAIMSLVKGEISAAAIGAGAAIIGIALSYSIHMLAHQNHVRTVEQLINELAYPLTVGSFTTIGAFFALVFTSSAILRDFGLFASLTLIGTTLFCLIFLP
ncbi:MAG: transporter, partial [Salinivirgaceae bacterium]|nr:transporter [Salinivirgaceae bacterium]